MTTPPRRSTPSPPATQQDAPRLHSRYAVTLAVRCTRLNARTPQTWRGRTADVSGGGFAIDLPTRLKPGSPVRVEVRTGIGPMWMDAEILWTRNVAGQPGTIRHGLCLANRSEMLQLPFGVLLGQWLRRYASQTSPRRPKAPRKAKTHQASPRGRRPGRP